MMAKPTSHGPEPIREPQAELTSPSGIKFTRSAGPRLNFRQRQNTAQTLLLSGKKASKFYMLVECAMFLHRVRGSIHSSPCRRRKPLERLTPSQAQT